MKSDQIRPEWRGFMLLFLRFGISPLAHGLLPSPIIILEDQGFRDRLLGRAQDFKPLLERGSCSAAALIEALLADEVASGDPIEVVVGVYEAACRSRRTRRRQSFSMKDVQELVGSAGIMFAERKIPDELADQQIYESSDEPKRSIEWFQWYVGVNTVSFFQWGIPFPFLLRIAREAPDPVAKTALARAISIDKAVLGLQWAIRRLEKAASRNDKDFMREIGEALKTPAVPKRLRADALDLFLCMFNQWLRALPLAGQAALLREAGLRVSVKALRNRRSRLRLSKVDRLAEVEIPKELQPLLSKRRTYS